MASFDVDEIRSQVRMLVGHDGLDTKVLLWTNRVCQEIASRAIWGAQIRRTLMSPGVNVTTVTSNWFSTGITSSDVVNVYRMEQAKMANATSVASYVGPLQRCSPESLHANYIGLNPASVSADTVEAYALVEWATMTNGTATSNVMYPKFAVHPGPTNATTTTGGVGGILAHYLYAPLALTSGSGATGTNWMISKYFDTVLAGVMRWARLYVGDAQGYLIEKAEFENGIATMRRNEETYSAQTPVFRGVVSEDIGRV